MTSKKINPRDGKLYPLTGNGGITDRLEKLQDEFAKIRVDHNRISRELLKKDNGQEIDALRAIVDADDAFDEMGLKVRQLMNLVDDVETQLADDADVEEDDDEEDEEDEIETRLDGIVQESRNHGLRAAKGIASDNTPGSLDSEHSVVVLFSNTEFGGVQWDVMFEFCEDSIGNMVASFYIETPTNSSDEYERHGTKYESNQKLRNAIRAFGSKYLIRPELIQSALDYLDTLEV